MSEAINKPAEEKKAAKYVLREVVEREVYQAAWDAKKRGEPIGWSSSKFPSEITEALGLNLVYPENQAAAIGAKHGGERMCEHAEAMGFDNDICAYARINLAYAAGHEAAEKPMPQPDFVLCCNNICNTMTKWYENLARMHNIPLIMIDVPYANTKEPDQNKIDYIRGQFDDAIKKLEEIAGHKMDMAKFEEACSNANRAAKAWLKVCSYLQYTPAPFAGFDLFNHMADIVTARAKKSTALAFEQLAEELEENVKTGKSTWKYDENHRIMFEGIPCWPQLGKLFKPLKERGINTTAVVYAPAFGFEYNNMDELMAAYCKAPNSVCIEKGVEWRETICKENNVDGILVHYNRSCKPWSGYMPEMERRFRKDLGVAVAGFDGDQADPRNFSEEQYNTRVEGLFEVMEANKAAKEGGNK
jgi:benzoyl-CoA reductase/2-hydroxyglutaryl-CoA dehydratase subunit BcrC/BadD/HgdB